LEIAVCCKKAGLMATGTPYTSDNLSSASCRKVTCQPTQPSIPAAAPEIILVETVTVNSNGSKRLEKTFLGQETAQ